MTSSLLSKLGDRELIEPLVSQLTPAANLCGGPGTGFTSIARLLGKATLMLGDRRAARLYFEQALKVCECLRYRPEAAFVHLELAELLLGERQPVARSEAVVRPEVAVSEMTEIHMRPDLERALSLRRQTHLSPAHAADVLSAPVSARSRLWSRRV